MSPYMSETQSVIELISNVKLKHSIINMFKQLYILWAKMLVVNKQVKQFHHRGPSPYSVLQHRVKPQLILATIGLILLIWFEPIEAYSNGAPLGESCRTLYPGHGVDKQYGRSSYRVSAMRRHNDSSIVVTIYSPTDTFLGFIMQARLYSDREMLVNGQFSSDQYSRALDCLGGLKNTLTHTDNYPKYKVESVWTPPKDFVSDIVFRATVVQSKNQFWTAIDSEPIELNPSNSFGSLSNGRVNNFNIHNSNPSGPNNAPSGFVMNKDSLNNGPNGPYHVASSLSPNSPFMTVSQQPLIQRFPISSDSFRDHQFFIDYNVCSRKLCFGLPTGCLRRRNCIMLLTSTFVPYTDSTVEFEVIADHKSAFNNKRLASYGLSSSISTTSAYYSMAFSHDRIMGNDSVTDCALLSDGRPQLLHSINTGKSNEELSDTEFHGVTVVNATYSNGMLYCKWRKRRRFTLRGTRFDLKESQYYIMMAYGRLATLNNFHRKEIHMDKVVSESLIDFKLVGFISAHSKMFLVKLHASFMVLAWVGFVSIGIITARYFKPLWLSHSMFGVRIWFAIHRSCMIMSIILITIGAISIAIYAETFVVGPHQIVGCIALAMAILNPIGAIFRPDCDAENRWVFNWIHWLMGNVGHICAIAAIFLAFELTTIRLPVAFLWSIAFYLFFHLTVHSLLTLYYCNCQHTKESGDINGNGSIQSNDTSQHIDSLADTSFIRYFFILYSSVISVFVLTIIGIIVLH
ncbi:DOMON domain-containing protein frrs1L [Blomia tropicalis]|nr:DOMON domain-containing protein frrs1L [Blomia tropicalis]